MAVSHPLVDATWTRNREWHRQSRVSLLGFGRRPGGWGIIGDDATGYHLHALSARDGHGDGEPALISLRRFFEKDVRERRAALATLMAAPLVRMVLRARGYAGTVRFLTKISRSPTTGLDEAVADARIAQAVIRRLPLDLSCLERSLVVWWLVGGSDVAQLRFGVAPGVEGGTPSFHAWVEVAGTVLDDAKEAGVAYLPLTPPSPLHPTSFD